MRLRLLSMLIALPLAGAVTTAWPADSVLPTEPKKRLEALQHALISACWSASRRFFGSVGSTLSAGQAVVTAPASGSAISIESRRRRMIGSSVRIVD